MKTNHKKHEVKRSKDPREPRICKPCGFLTRDEECLVCGKATESYDPSKIMRFPRLRLPEGPKKFTDKQVTRLIERRCESFDCPGTVVEARRGPVVTEFVFEPDWMTSIKRLKTLPEDLALVLAVEAVTIQKVPGRVAIGITVPNYERKPVTFEECIHNMTEKRDEMTLPINFGLTHKGEPYIEDLADMPHLLVGGSTGSGKSVFLNNVISSLLWVRTPKQLQFIMIDPKSVELNPYKGIPHLMFPPVNSVYNALALLEDVIRAMEERVIMLSMFRKKNLIEFNASMPEDKRQPHIVIVIDELTDFMIQEKTKFTELLARISSKARAAGIHIIAATQRPSVKVVSGDMKVNFPARAAFRMVSRGDSMTILDETGAENLIGRGDMFYRSPKMPGLQRLHSPFCRTEDMEKIKDISVQLSDSGYVPADSKEVVTAEVIREEERKQEVRGALPPAMTKEQLFGVLRRLDKEKGTNVVSSSPETQRKFAKAFLDARKRVSSDSEAFDAAYHYIKQMM